jgi:hypothetical protein
MHLRIGFIRSLISLVFVSVLPILFAVLVWSPEIDAESAEKVKLAQEAMRQNMLVMTRQLGVTCNICHNPDNFKADDKLPFKIAKDHIRITQLLLDSGFDGKGGRPKADCYMCHRGKLTPEYIEHVDPMQKDPLAKKKETLPEE